MASLARPGGNATGVNFLVGEIVAKRVGLLHELAPKAARIAVLGNPATGTTMFRDVSLAARAIGLETQSYSASTGREIEAAFATLVRERAEAVFVWQTPCSTVGARNLPPRRRTIRFPWPIPVASMSKPAG